MTGYNFFCMNFLRIKNFVLILTVAVLAGGVGYKLGTHDVKTKWVNFKPNFEVSNKLPPENRGADFSLFWSVWEEVTQKYVDKTKLDAKKMVYGAISGMVASIGDPYTLFLAPDKNKESKEELNGSFEGIGAQLGNKDKKIVVIAPLAGQPAEKAGIKAGDWIIKIDGKEIGNLILPEVVAKIRGPKGTTVTLTVVHPGADKPTDVAITRDKIILKSVDWKPVGKNLAQIQLVRFGDETNSQWDQTVKEINEKKVAGVILDLRNNPGGYLTDSVYVASEFLPSGVVVKQQRYDGQTQTYSVNRPGKFLDIPLVILVNQGTASAGEILAGALQAAGRGKIVGTQSFGKGSVQEVEDLSNGAGLHITTAKWLLSNDVWINGVGLTPDIKIENDDKQPEKDLQLEKAVQVLETASK